jgi:predicted dehydrogenase
MTMSLTRRRFVQTSAATAAAASLPWLIPTKVRGANSEIRAAVVGFNGRGRGHISSLRAQAKNGVKLVALCDVDAKVLGSAKAEIEKKDNTTIQGYADVRKLLDNKDIDVISTATPNHWHSLIAIWGVQAGKDVYVEKPVSHNVWEGRQAVNAARKYNKIILTGTQSRSSTGIAETVAYVRAGNLGKIKYVVGTCYKRRDSIGKLDSPLEIPASVDYELWCGPAEKRDLFRKKFHYDWHWDFNTGNGDLGNQGIHQMDIARWFLGEQTLSPKVMCIGGRVGYDDAGNTPNTQIVYHEYAAAPLIFEVRGLPASAKKTKSESGDKRKADVMGAYRGSTVGVVVQCEHGYVVCPGYTGCSVYDNDGKLIKEFKGSEEHFGTFINAVKTRKLDPMRGEIEQGHLSSGLCHTGNISYRLGKKLGADAIKEQIKSVHDDSESFGRMLEHLAANNIDVKSPVLTLGPWLKMDPKTERFIDNEEANKLLTRTYRAPFTVPTISV